MVWIHLNKTVNGDGDVICRLIWELTLLSDPKLFDNWCFKFKMYMNFAFYSMTYPYFQFQKYRKLAWDRCHIYPLGLPPQRF